MTTRGSRPGDTCADIHEFFGLLAKSGESISGSWLEPGRITRVPLEMAKSALTFLLMRPGLLWM